MDRMLGEVRDCCVDIKQSQSSNPPPPPSQTKSQERRYLKSLMRGVLLGLADWLELQYQRQEQDADVFSRVVLNSEAGSGMAVTTTMHDAVNELNSTEL